MMGKLIGAVRSKMRGTRGETLTEVLAAIVISGLALLVLATVIAAAADVNQRSRKAMDEYYAANNQVVEGTTGSAEGTVRLSEIKLNNTGDGSVDVVYRISTQEDGTVIVSYSEKESGATGE